MFPFNAKSCRVSSSVYLDYRKTTLLDVFVAWFLRGTDPLDGIFLFLRVQSSVSDVKRSLHSPASKPQPNPNKIHAIDKFVGLKVIFTAFESMEGYITTFFSISRQLLDWNCYFFLATLSIIISGCQQK